MYNGIVIKNIKHEEHIGNYVRHYNNKIYVSIINDDNDDFMIKCLNTTKILFQAPEYFSEMDICGNILIVQYGMYVSFYDLNTDELIYTKRGSYYVIDCYMMIIFNNTMIIYDVKLNFINKIEILSSGCVTMNNIIKCGNKYVINSTCTIISTHITDLKWPTTQ